MRSNIYGRLLLSITAISVLGSQEKKSTIYRIDRHKLRELWYSATVRGLIKAKSREAMTKVQEIDAILYKQCERDARNAIDLARCATKLFNARDAELNRREEYFKNSLYSTVQKKLKAKPLLKDFVRKRPKSKSDFWIRISHKEPQKINMNAILADLQKVTDRWNKGRIPLIERQRTEESLGQLAEAYEKALLRENKKQWRSEAERRKRKVDPMMSLTKSSLDYSKIAANYFSKLFGLNEPQTHHLENLVVLKEYFNKANKIQEYYSLMNKENSKLYSQLNIPIHIREPQIQTNENDVLEHVLDLINSFTTTHLKSDSKLSILSPRFFSILPEANIPRLLSPNMLSFQNDGVFSLPDLFEIVSSNQEYQKIMLELIMDISGAGQALETVMGTLKKDIDEMNKVRYPLMQEMSKHDHDWMRAHRLLSKEQNEHYNKFGYTHLNKEQMELVYKNQRFISGGWLNISEMASLSNEERDRQLEEKIKHLSMIDYPIQEEHRRVKKQTDEILSSNETFNGNLTLFDTEDGNGSEGPEEANGTEHKGIEFITLRANAFANFVGVGGVLEAITLSPDAFISEVLSPEFMVAKTLSPDTFIFSLLSPDAMIARILSPTAFRSEILSPRALYPWILSPEALITEILSPRFLEPHILSPEVLLIKVLSPAILSPNIGSAEMLGVLVLSPNILSPRIASQEDFLVEILSPHILGGPHGKHDSSVISIGGGEHEHEHKEGDEGGAAHVGDVHVHRGELEGDHQHDLLQVPNHAGSLESNLNQALG